MRETLFKAKRIDNGEWVEGFFVNAREEYGHGERTAEIITMKAERICNGEYSYTEAFVVDETTLCQYTGLTDKDGNKIWENDLCNCIYDGNLAVRVIVWDKSELDFKGTNGKENYKTEYDYLGCCEEIEVIGNIFDNPELIGEQNG